MSVKQQNYGTDNFIVVGVDGSDHSTAAVMWGAAESHRRTATLRLLSAYRPPIQTFVGPGMPPVDIGDAQREWGRTVLQEAEAAVSGRFPDLPVVSALRHDLTVPALLKEGERALMTVVGAQGAHHFAGMLLGSANRMATHSNGPVVVVRTEPRQGAADQRRPVVVGLDGSAGSDEALRSRSRRPLSGVCDCRPFACGTTPPPTDSPVRTRWRSTST